jgi:hypothetical protein
MMTSFANLLHLLCRSLLLASMANGSLRGSAQVREMQQQPPGTGRRTDTIYLEACWQLCDPTYQELLLGLPMVP